MHRSRHANIECNARHIHRRGRDGKRSSVCDDQSVAVGKRRLSIIDQTGLAHPPGLGHDMSKIFFINRFFYPDHSATSQILSDLAFYLTGVGRTVHVITSGQVYDNPSARLPAYESVHGVCIHRVASTGFGRAGLLGRLLDYITFYRSAFALLRPARRRGRYRRCQDGSSSALNTSCIHRTKEASASGQLVARHLSRDCY